MTQSLPASLTLENGDLVLISPFNRDLIDDLKAQISYQDRTWDPARKVWRVKYQHGSVLVELVKKYLRQDIKVPSQVTYSDSYVHTRLFKVEYIGAARLRDDGSQTATGYVAGQWSIIFPQDVLVAWFGDQKPNDPQTYFSILGVKKTATPEEIKKAYRLAARTWHPDVNKEPNAPEQFRRIQEAWEVLRDDQLKRKYMAGLKFEQSLARYEERGASENSWCPPVRCGWVTVECTESVGKFLVKKIHSWQEIQNETGKIMVSYWPKGQDQFKSEFI